MFWVVHILSASLISRFVGSIASAGPRWFYLMPLWSDASYWTCMPPLCWTTMWAFLFCTCLFDLMHMLAACAPQVPEGAPALLRDMVVAGPLRRWLRLVRGPLALSASQPELCCRCVVSDLLGCNRSCLSGVHGWAGGDCATFSVPHLCPLRARMFGACTSVGVR